MGPSIILTIISCIYKNKTLLSLSLSHVHLLTQSKVLKVAFFLLLMPANNASYKNGKPPHPLLIIEIWWNLIIYIQYIHIHIHIVIHHMDSSLIDWLLWTHHKLIIAWHLHVLILFHTIFFYFLLISTYIFP